MGTVVKTEINDQDKILLRECIKVAHEAMEKGNHPFGSVLADENGKILLRMGNRFTDGGSSYHAETLLTLEAAKQYSPEFLAKCTLYTNFEPCVMCTGAIYWANIGRICYAVSEKTLLSLTGSNDENPTFSLSAEDVIKAGQKTVIISGPVAESDPLTAEIVKDHIGFWK